MIHRRHATSFRDASRTLRRVSATVAALSLVLVTTACDGLLDVTLPGNLEEGDLDNPALAPILVLGARSDFDCGLNAWIRTTGLWTGEFYSASTSLSQGAVEARRALVEQYGPGECNSGSSPNIAGVWLPFQTSRFQAESAVARIEGWPEEEVPNRDLLLAEANAYAGYSYQYLGEGFCELFFDRGPRTTREETYRLAEARFTAALAHADEALSGSTASAARSLRNLALVGRARARLFLGDAAGVLADASLVDAGFVRLADHSSLNSRRRNNIFQENNVSRNISAAVKDFGLTVGGLPDPRVPVQRSNLRGSAGRTDLYVQQKYTSLAAPVRVASWREARLMIAEVSGGAVAVEIINQLRSAHGLPSFASSNPAEIRSVLNEERRRELYLEGQRLGDMLRLDLPFPTGITPGGESIDTSTSTCLPTMAAERLGNPNAR